MEKIFVLIPSYRDAECQHTLKDLFEKATHPERVFAGVCWVREKTQDPACYQSINAFPSQVRHVEFAHDQENGLNWARQQALTLWQGEEYTLSIHAHMRFAKGWDDILIKQLKKCPSKKPVLSTCPPAYTPPDKLQSMDTSIATRTVVAKITPGQHQLLGLTGRLIPKDTKLTAPMRTAFSMSSFVFARSEIFQEIPPDPHLYYFNTELANSARLWTHGWDIFQPTEFVVFHWYGRTESFPRPYREYNNTRHVLSKMRSHHLLRMKAAEKSEALVDFDKYSLGTERTLEDFWQFSGINPTRSHMAAQATNGEYEEPFKEYERKLKSQEEKLPRIFVQIASYRDPECQWTIKDLFEKARYPDRINVGVCWQYDPEEDEDCFKIVVRPEQVKISPYHWKEGKGVCWARYEAQQLFDGEEYVLMIDSHMRFEFNWDETCVNELAQCRSAKSLLSNHPARYTPPHELEAKPMPTALHVKQFTEAGDIRVAGGYMHKIPPYPLRGAFIAAGFIFAKGEIIKEVPYDPHMYFNQEEVSLGARLFTHGWDVYHPSKALAYHFYNTGAETKKRKLHWSDNKEWGGTQSVAKQRFEHLLGMTEASNPRVLVELDRYGHGKERTLAEYEEFSGVDFKKRVVDEKAVNYGVTDELRSYMRHDAVSPMAGPSSNNPVNSFPDPEQSMMMPYNVMLMANGVQRTLEVDRDAPDGVLIIKNYIEPSICKALVNFADAQAYKSLGVVDYKNSTDEKVASRKDNGRITHYVEIGNVVCEVLNIFNDIYCHRMAPYYNVAFEWYERPQILRYPVGGKYNQHSDADQWLADKKEWLRVQDRDYSVLLYLNDEFEGGDLKFINQNFTIKPKPGMLVAFPSDYNYMHAALPTTKGIRYVIVSWGAIVGKERVRKQPPHASVFLHQKKPGEK